LDDLYSLLNMELLFMMLMWSLQFVFVSGRHIIPTERLRMRPCAVMLLLAAIWGWIPFGFWRIKRSVLRGSMVDGGGRLVDGS
jgi:hypothetical protein